MAYTSSRSSQDTSRFPSMDERKLDVSEIEDYFRGSSVFITGGTGFVGKLLIEKLLRSCQDIKRLYLLCRPKKGKDITKRLEEQFSDSLYDLAKKNNPNVMSKIVAISGDCTQKDLGISDDDKKMLFREVDIVFHSAASIRFDEPLRTAVAVNVRGPRDLLLLARRMTRLRAYVHVSTAYSYCVRENVDEMFYDPPVGGDELLALIESMDASVLERITPALLGDFPNTYTYTKAVAEDIVKCYSKCMPVAVVRPSIILATCKEPYVGWIDSVYGATGLVTCIILGLLRTLHCDSRLVADLIPGDFVVNTCIAAAWDIGRTRSDNPNKEIPDPDPQTVMDEDLVYEEPLVKNTDAVPVYNCVSSAQNPLTWGAFVSLLHKYSVTIPTCRMVWYYFFTLNKRSYVNEIYRFFFHWVPAYIADAALLCLGKKPIQVETYIKLHKLSKVLSFFTTRQWTFSNRNTQRLFGKLNATDKKLYEFNMANMSWTDYMKNYTYGVRVYILKDPLETLPRGLRKQKLLKTAHYILFLCLVLIVYWVVTFVFKLIF